MQPCVLNKEIREKYSLLSKVQAIEHQDKTGTSRKSVGNQGKKIKIRFFRGKWDKENTMLFATEFF